MGIAPETTVDVTLGDTAAHEIPGSAAGPWINQNGKIRALLVGHSSADIKGLLIIPGVIDADDAGRIHVTVHTLCPPPFVPKSSGIA